MKRTMGMHVDWRVGAALALLWSAQALSLGCEVGVVEHAGPITLGLGEDAFVDAPDGGELVVYFGAQGGTHTFASIRLTDLDPGDPELANSNKANPQVHYRLEAVDSGEALGEATLRFPFTPVEGEVGVYELVGLTMFLDGKTCADTAGREVRVTVDVTDASGQVGTDSRTWLAVADAETCAESEPAAADGSVHGEGATQEPVVILGHGDEAFVEAPEGDELVVYFGPQGGTHAFCSVRMAGMDPGDPELANSNKANPLVHYLVEAADGSEVLGEATLRFPFVAVEGDDGVYELVGLTMFLEGKTCGATAGAEVLVTLAVTDADGVTASDSRTWLAVMDPDTCPDHPPSEAPHER